MARTKQTSRKSTGAISTKRTRRPLASYYFDDLDTTVADSEMTNNNDPRRPTSDAMRYDKDLVTISVGKSHPQREFAIRRSIVGNSSKLLYRTFCTPAFVERHEMPTENPELFNLYVNWLHTGIIATKKSDQQNEEGSDSNGNQGEYDQLAQLHLLSQRIEDIGFANAVIDAFLGKLREYKTSERAENTVDILPGPTCIEYAYTESHKDNEKLKTLLVKTYAAEDCETILKQCGLDRFPEQFRNDLLVELLARRLPLRSRVTNVDNCVFHVHSKGETCVTEGSSRKRKRGGTDE